MRIILLLIVLFFNVSFAQKFVSSNENRHSFQLGYSENAEQIMGVNNGKLINFTYSYGDDRFQLTISYFQSKAYKANSEYDGKPQNKLFVPKIDYNGQFFGFSFGLMFLNSINIEAPDGLIIPVVSLKLGIISDYYFSASFLDEESIPSLLSFNLNYIFNNSLSFLKVGTSYFNDWSYNSEIQYSFFDLILFRLRGIYNPKIDRGFYYAGIGFFFII